jgi:hypothetical protein
MAELGNFCNGNESDDKELSQEQDHDRSQAGQGGCFVVVARFGSR